MIGSRLALTLTLAAAAWPALPQAAQAHTVGGGAPVATAHQAVVTSVPPGIAAQVIEGDQRLGLAVNPQLTVIVRGLLGEPFLRFSRGGVYENLNSPTTYLDRPVPQQPPHGLVRTLPAHWSQLTTGHTYIWHEDRLHALAGIDGRTTWSIPLTVDGRPTAVSGALEYAPTPTRIWIWPLIAALACAAALLRLRSQTTTARLARGAALLALPAVLTLRLGRQFEGHPDVTLLQNLDTAVTLAVLAWLAYLLVRGDGRTWPGAAFLTAALGIYEGLATLPVLTQGTVLMVLPATVVRCAAVGSLTAGSVALAAVVCVRTPGRTEVPRSV